MCSLEQLHTTSMILLNGATTSLADVLTGATTYYKHDIAQWSNYKPG